MATTLLYKMAYPSLVAYTNIDHVLQELTPYMLHTNYVERTPVPVSVPFVPLPVQAQVPLPVQAQVPLPVQVPIPLIVYEPTPAPQQITRVPSSLPPSLFRPKSEDTLFWCVYVAKHGIQEYREIPTNRYKNREIEEKQKIAAHFHTSPATRPAKMSMVLLKELLGEISTDRRMTLRTLPLWCIFYELSCVHVLNTSNKTYLTYKFVTGGDQEQEFLYYDPKCRKYSVFVDDTLDSSKIKPDLSAMLQIDTYKKQDLYQALYNHCIWVME